ncbi:class E basic helix-loop-helix protein 41 [Callorhinchus milii]|nr:class E basic helix-loop-helix protein 41 [Callorhinchus milii]
MEDNIPGLQTPVCLSERKLLDNADFIGVEYPSMYMFKSKRGLKRDDSKEAYKLPHRLIEKKRRDRINECISQLKDLLPEHLKLTTLGHLEKAVVLELTLKHLKALSALTEQQHQKIIALQSGDGSLKSPLQSDLDAFHSGFHTCAREVLQYLSRFEHWTPREQRCAQLINHLQSVSTQLLPQTPSATTINNNNSSSNNNKASVSERRPGPAKAETHSNSGNCVPVIQRTHTAELNENDTDTDSGYGGEGDRDKCEGRNEKEFSRGQRAFPTLCTSHELPSRDLHIKQEPDSPPTKRVKADGAAAGGGGGMTNPDVRQEDSALNSLMGIGSVSALAQQTPFCLPFYFLSPSAAASYLPLLDKNSLEKFWCPAPIPVIYPGIRGLRGIPALAHEKLGGPFPLLSQRVLSPALGTATARADSTQQQLESERVSSPAREPPQTGNDPS